MNDDRSGGAALVVGALLGIVTMSLHPTGHDLAASDGAASIETLAIAVHALVIASLPITFLGAMALTRRIDSPARLATSALVIHGFGAVSVMIAAAVSGFLGPHLVHQAAADPTNETARLFLDYNARVNQVFARMFVAASSIAIFLWSASIVRTRVLAAGLGVYGIVIATVTIAALASGHLRLDVHGMGAVVLAQAVWLVIAGVSLFRRGSAGA